jgi:hypothetical protein
MTVLLAANLARVVWHHQKPVLVEVAWRPSWGLLNHWQNGTIPTETFQHPLHKLSYVRQRQLVPAFIATSRRARHRESYSLQPLLEQVYIAICPLALHKASFSRGEHLHDGQCQATMLSVGGHPVDNPYDLSRVHWEERADPRMLRGSVVQA